MIIPLKLTQNNLSFILGFTMQLHDFAQQLANTDTTKAAQLVLDHYLHGFGFRYYAFTYYASHIKSGRKLNYDCVSAALKPWHQYYLEQGYADVDRTLEDISTLTLPFPWDVPSQLQAAKNNREKKVRRESIQFGINKGLSIPIHGPNYDFATLTLHQCRGEHTLEHYEKYQFEWLSAGLLFYHHIKRILNLAVSTQSLKHALTKREIQCLSLTAKGWRVEQIAKELKISPRTVNFHLQNANKKLGTNNKYQASYKYFSG